MARYFFHLRGGSLEADDEEGVDLPDLAAGRAEAVHAARSIIAAEVLEGRLSLAERIEVEDADRRPLFVLPFSAAIQQPT